jgi:YrbI family 3-deoxy-D-manno-octulosonate 8-phosphate phosphatase
LIFKFIKINKQKIIKLNSIDLIVYDFDGVMTDNKALFFQDGKEGVMVNRADSLAINLIREKSIPQLILSTEANPVVQARAKKINLDVISACENKKDALIEYCKRNEFDLNKIVYIGNDINDLEVMKIVGYSVAPADAYPQILKIAKFITKAKGGCGVIRDFYEGFLEK